MAFRVVNSIYSFTHLLMDVCICYMLLYTGCASGCTPKKGKKIFTWSTEEQKINNTVTWILYYLVSPKQNTLLLILHFPQG